MTTPSHFGSTGGHLERNSAPPEEPITPLLIARQALPCSWHHCIVQIVIGDPVYLLDSGWVHALHLEGVE